MTQQRQHPDADWGSSPTQCLWRALEAEDWAGVLALWTDIAASGSAGARDYAGAAIALRRQGSLDAGERMIEAGLRPFPDDTRLLIDHAWVAFERKEWVLATARWRTVLARLPEQPTGPVGLAVCLIQLGRLDEAEDVLADGLIRFPEHPPALLEWARLAHRRGDWTEAVRRCELARTRSRQFGLVAPILAAALRHCGRLDEAQAVIAELLPGGLATPSLLAEHAAIAQARGDWPEAARRWLAVLAAAGGDAPELRTAYAMAATALQHDGRADAAEDLLRDGIARLPHAAELRAAWAYAARSRGDLAEALGRWGELTVRQPGVAEGYVGASHALRELGRAAEAEAVLAPALKLFPDDLHVLTEHAWNGERLAARAGGGAEVVRRWTALRSRFPGSPDGYVHGAEACLQAGLPDEAEALLAQASERFPQDVSAAIARARLAFDRDDLPTAFVRWRQAVERFADNPLPYVGAIDAMCHGKRLDEAEQLARTASLRFPADREIGAAFARVATWRGDHFEAMRRWEAVRAAWPDAVDMYRGFAAALREAGRFNDTQTLLAQGLRLHPGDFELERQRALAFSAARDWPRALPLWDALKRRAPDHAGLRSELRHVLWQARLDHAILTTDAGGAARPPFDIPSGLLEDAAARAAEEQATRALLMRFESLGDTCEFGILQRRFGAEPLGLLRWASVEPDDLLAALRARFAGIGTPEQTVLGVTDGAYTLLDTRYHFYFATFTFEHQEPRETFYPEQCQRMRFLRRALVETLEAGTRILVYKHSDCSTGQLVALHDAITAYHPRAALLGVRLHQAGQPSGSVELLRDGLVVGYVDRFSNVDVAVASWLAVCRQALRLCGLEDELAGI